MRNGRKSASESASTNGDFAVNEIEPSPQLELTVTTSRGTSIQAPVAKKTPRTGAAPRRGVGGWVVRLAAPIIVRAGSTDSGLDSRLSWNPSQLWDGGWDR